MKGTSNMFNRRYLLSFCKSCVLEGISETPQHFLFQNQYKNFERDQEMVAAADTGHIVPADVLDYLENRF